MLGCLLFVADSFVIFLDSSQFDLFLIAMDRFSLVCYPWPLVVVDIWISTESLILAQDERWRRA